MKLRVTTNGLTALTLTDLLVVVLILFVLLVVAVSFLPEPRLKKKTARVQCINNLKQVGLAYRIWAGDNNDKFPMEVSITNGGAAEEAAQSCWINYLVMANELSTPKILVCPADEDHFPATNFSTGISRKNISYFVGLDATTIFPAAILSGDDNLTINANPAGSGVLWLEGRSSICWSTNRHRVGNIGFADGSVEMPHSLSLSNYLSKTGLATNRLAIP